MRCVCSLPEVGLNNGAMATVKAICYQNYIIVSASALVKFNAYPGTTLVDDTVPITLSDEHGLLLVPSAQHPIKVSLDCNDPQGSRQCSFISTLVRPSSLGHE